MSTKNKNAKYTVSVSNQDVTADKTKKAPSKKLWIIIAIVAAVVAIATTVAVIWIVRNNDDEGNDLPEAAVDADGRFDYMNSDMSKYVAVDEDLYKNTTVKLPSYLDGSDEAVNEYIQLLRKTHAVSTGKKIVDQPIKDGDSVAIYYEGWLGDTKFDGGSNMSDESPYILEIGSGTFIPGFEDGLIGVVPNTTSKESPFNLNVTFPESYHSADLAGKAVVFKVYVVYIQEKVPAEYTDEFITKTIGYTTTETNVKAAFEKHLKEEYLPEMKKNEIVNAIWLDLTNGSVILHYPESEIDYFYDAYLEQYESYRTYYAQYNITFNTLDEFVIAYLGLEANADWKEATREQCKVDIEQNLIFHAIAQEQGFVITDTDYQNALQYYVDYYSKQSQGQEITAKDIEENLGVRMIKEEALWQKVNDFIAANCTPTYE